MADRQEPPPNATNCPPGGQFQSRHGAAMVTDRVEVADSSPRFRGRPTGHGLTTKNVVALMAIPEIVELNIGHAMIADAVFSGLHGAVRAMLTAMERGRAGR